MGGAHLAGVGGRARLLGSGSQVSGVSIAAGNAHFVGSWVPISEVPRKSKGLILPGDFFHLLGTPQPLLWLAKRPSPATSSLQSIGPLITCLDGKGKGPQIVP